MFYNCLSQKREEQEKAKREEEERAKKLQEEEERLQADMQKQREEQKEKELAEIQVGLRSVSPHCPSSADYVPSLLTPAGPGRHGQPDAADGHGHPEQHAGTCC